MTYRVKPLQWTQLGDGKGRDIYSTIHWAKSPYGSFYIGLQPRGENPFDWSGPNNSGKRDFQSPDDAKAAAQADYEARILAAIEPAPSVREAARVLLGAWRNSQTIDADEKAQDYADIHECDVDAGRILEPWLRAIAEGKDDE